MEKAKERIEEEKMISQIEKIVKETCQRGRRLDQYKYHVQLVRKYSLKLAKKYKVNKTVVELAALLHDIGRFKFGEKDHEIFGVKEAEKILRKFDYSTEIIKKVKDCIFVHRHSQKKKIKILEAKIVKDADAISHFMALPVLFAGAYIHKKMDPAKGWNWVYKKIDRDWNSLILPESRKIVKEKYQAIRSIFSEFKE